MSKGKPSIRTIEAGSTHAELAEQLGEKVVEFATADLSSLKQVEEKEAKAIFANCNQKLVLRK